MKVQDLKDLLAGLPDDMEVIEKRYSDYQSMELDCWRVVDAVGTGNGWLMRAHHSMSPENRANSRKCLFFSGN